MNSREDFDRLLAEAVQFHGHLCAGQIIGVRMAMLGLRELGIDPVGADRKRLIVFVEIDRCATDAIMTVTGCRLGRRNLKLLDFGKMAATFVDTATMRAVRIVSAADSREKAARMFPKLEKNDAQMRGYREMADADLFTVQDVAVTIRPEDMPGRPLGHELCASCGEAILDLREVRRDGQAVCRSCAGGEQYFQPLAAHRLPCTCGGMP